jgi:hypothetical protein
MRVVSPLLRFVCLAFVGLAAAQQPTEPAAEPPLEQPVFCPLNSESFNELSAAATILLGMGKDREAEACLLGATAGVFPVLRALSDISANRGDFGRAASFSQLLEMMDSSSETTLFHAKRLLQNAEDDGKTECHEIDGRRHPARTLHRLPARACARRASLERNASGNTAWGGGVRATDIDIRGWRLNRVVWPCLSDTGVTVFSARRRAEAPA